MNIKKGDTVKILAGKDKGKDGKVMKINIETYRAIVEGLNLYKKHIKPKRQGEKGEVISISRPIPVSNLGLLCSSCGKATRVGYRFENNNKIRYCKKCKNKV